MSESKTYREYAQDCVRIAEKMSGADKATLLKIAKAWDARAAEAEREAERRGKNAG